MAQLRESGAASILQTRGLEVGYRTRRVLGDVYLEVSPGEVLCLVGANGCGKSTLLKTLARQLEPLGGSVLLDGADARGMRARDFARKVSVMLTGQPASEMLSCLDVVETGRIPYTDGLGRLCDPDKQAVEQAMRATGSWHLRGRDFMQISDGQRQRVLLARAIAQEPAAMLLDEPMSYLDVRHQLELLATLRGMARDTGCALVMSLHEMSLVGKVADKVACVCDGAVMAQGTPEEVLGEAVMGQVFGLEDCAYDEVLGSVERAPLASPARVFVLAGAGRAAGAMRALRRAQVGFCAGILAENDVDCVIAKRLTSHVLSVPEFCAVDENALARGLEALQGCEALLDCLGEHLGPANERCEELRQAAREMGMRVFADVQECLESLGREAGAAGEADWRQAAGKHRGRRGGAGAADTQAADKRPACTNGVSKEAAAAEVDGGDKGALA